MGITKKFLEECIKQLKTDLGIVPYSSNLEKFGRMTMSECEQNIDNFIKILEEKL